jgi:hypothetical protein
MQPPQDIAQSVLARKAKRQELLEGIRRLAHKSLSDTGAKSFTAAEADDLERMLDEHAAVAPWGREPEDEADPQLVHLKAVLRDHDLRAERLAKLMLDEGPNRFQAEALEGYEIERQQMIGTLKSILGEG